MEEHRCPGCGRPTTTPDVLCAVCCTSGYSQSPGSWHSESLEDLERLDREKQEDMERLERSRAPTEEDLERLKRVEQWKREVTPSSGANANDSPTEIASQSPKKLGTGTTYSSSQVATAAGKAVAAVGAGDLPLEGQIEALELARRWLTGLRE